MASLHQSATKSARRAGRAATSRTGGIRLERIEGGFIKITTHQLVMAAWLFREKHISRQELRLFLAAFELRERRRHMPADDRKGRKPNYRLEEIQKLVGGGERKLRTDLNRLAKLGLVALDRHALSIATSIDQIRLDDVSGFWRMYRCVENQNRPIPVPRRTLRAMAAGFGRVETIFMIGILIRCLFFHRAQGNYRIDGRMKISWLCEIFGVGRRAAIKARGRLIELGWIEPIECPQHELNRWGMRHRVVTDWIMPTFDDRQGDDSGIHAPENAPPPAVSAPENAPPCLNQKASLTRTLTKTRRLRTGVSVETDLDGGGRRQPRGQRAKRTACGSGGTRRPRLRDIQAGDLGSTETLLALHRQAVRERLIPDSEAGLLDFMAFAERAVRVGHNPGGMFKWLLVNRRYDFITQADEDAAARRLRILRDGDPDELAAIEAGQGGLGEKKQAPPGAPRDPSADDIIVERCFRTAKQITATRRLQVDAFMVAHEGYGWSRDRWQQARLAYEQNQRKRWQGAQAREACDAFQTC